MTETSTDEHTSPWHDGTCNRCKRETSVAVGCMPGMAYSQAVCYFCLIAVTNGADPFNADDMKICGDFRPGSTDETDPVWAYCLECDWHKDAHDLWKEANG